MFNETTETASSTNSTLGFPFQFPDFLKIVPSFIDLRSIIMKSEMEVLSNVYEVVHQIRQIFSSAKLYLKVSVTLLLFPCLISASCRVDIAAGKHNWDSPPQCQLSGVV